MTIEALDWIYEPAGGPAEHERYGIGFIANTHSGDRIEVYKPVANRLRDPRIIYIDNYQVVITSKAGHKIYDSQGDYIYEGSPDPFVVQSIAGTIYKQIKLGVY